MGVILPIIAPECQWMLMSNEEAKFIADKMKNDPEFEARMLQNQKRTLCELLDPRLSNPVWLDMTIERALQLYNKK